MRELKENTQLSPFTHLNIVVNRNESRQTATTRIRVIYPFKFSIDKGANSSEDMLAVARSHADEIADVIGNVEAKLQMAFIIVNKQTQAVFDVNFSKQYFAQADKAQLLNTTIFAYVSEYELICEIVDADVTIQPLPPYPPIPVKPTQHNTLMGLDYAHAGHTGFQPTLTSDNAGEGIDIADGVISCTVNGAEWGNITGDIDDQTDLTNALNSKQDTLTAGTNINIDSNNVISAVDTKYTQGTGITIDHNNVVSNDVSPLVPAQATPTNQLADKDFVNSSIATSTATFRGTYNVVTDLHLSTSATHQQVATALGNTISLADNNDYCFVAIPTDDLTPTETLQVDRYKYNGSSWSFEYTLNNSGYTSAQWKAINSGITSGKVTQYDDYATSKQDTLIAGTNITIDVDGKTISSDIPQATQSVAGKVLLGAAGGAATYESVENRLPICYPTTASDINTTSMILKSSVDGNGRMLTENGFVYNTSGNPTVSDTKVVCDLGVGFFEKKLENLTVNTEYHIKSYGQNAGGLVYGSELVQRTLGFPMNNIMLWLTAESVGTNKLIDLSENNNDFELATGTLNIKPNAINGKPSIVFDGNTVYFGGFGLNIYDNNITWFIVAEDKGSTANNPFFISKQKVGTPQDAWGLGPKSFLCSPSTNITYSIRSGFNLYKFERNILYLTKSVTLNNNDILGSNSITNVNKNGNTRVYLSDTANADNSTFGGTNRFIGEIAEIIMLNTIDASIVGVMNDYLNTKYNIQ